MNDCLRAYQGISRQLHLVSKACHAYIYAVPLPAEGLYKKHCCRTSCWFTKALHAVHLTFCAAGVQDMHAKQC